MLDHIFINLPQLETDRLLLRKLVYSDKSNIFEYAQNPNVAKYVLWDEHQSELDSLAFLNIVYEAYNKNEAAPWGISLKNLNKIIGTAGFVKWDKNNNTAEIGYALSENYWGQGIIPEAIQEIIKFGFEKMNLDKISAECHSNNLGSIKVLEKGQFNFENEIENKTEIKGKLCNMKTFSILRNNFRN